MKLIPVLVIPFLILTGSFAGAVQQKAPSTVPLTKVGSKLESRYTDQLNKLQKTIASKLPDQSQADEKTLNKFLTGDELDAKFAQFVVLLEGTPRGLAEFAQQSKRNAELIDRLLADNDLMKRMLVADGASTTRVGRNKDGPAQYGPAMSIYSDILISNRRANAGILNRLALAISLEHAVPITQSNPTSKTHAPEKVDPFKRYQHYQQAYLDGELDPAFERLSAWELRMVVNGDEPDETLAWGREMLRNYRPDHIYNKNYGWRYVNIVTSDVKYGSQDVKHDKPELQKYQNILMNGGVCGRRAFIGRFILRSFGIPTTARPSRGHAALAHWTPDGWVVNLGGGWGAGWTKTKYRQDVDFLASTQARNNPAEYLKVKRAQWAGDVAGETRVYGEQDGTPEYWNGVALRVQRAIIENSNTQTLAALGEDLGEANEPTVAEKVIASPVTPKDRKIDYDTNGTISIPAAAYNKPKGNTRDVVAMKSFRGGLQIFLPRFFPQGKTILRGGTWKGEADDCTSGKRMPSGGYGRYENWGLRVALTPVRQDAPAELSLDLGDGVKIEFVYIKPGRFVMGGESKEDGRFHCVELPKHDVQLTRGFHLGKYEVTQAQYQAVMGTNPSKSTKDPDCPVDNVSEADALAFCLKLSELTGMANRLPTEAEWEFACRAGSGSKWFFGDDPSSLDQYAWFKGNAGGKSHKVGQKQPNPWGLYDIYGNVCERIADKYSRNYYSISPTMDPTGPSQGTKSKFEYQVTAIRSGKYRLTAEVVSANEGQRLNVTENNSNFVSVMEMPFTMGSWQESKPVTVELKKGENTLRFWRDQPPQYGLAIKRFTLTPID